jgi:hypothetical protein
MLVRSRLVVKLSADRVEGLLPRGAAEPFDPLREGHEGVCCGRPGEDVAVGDDWSTRPASSSSRSSGTHDRRMDSLCRR